jgi:WD40 repeat protein
MRHAKVHAANAPRAAEGWMPYAKLHRPRAATYGSLQSKFQTPTVWVPGLYLAENPICLPSFPLVACRHSASLVGVVAVEDKHELVTADSTGMLKLWDLRTFRCIQTFTTEHVPGDMDDLRGMTSLVSQSGGEG